MASAGECPAAADFLGWYYDDPLNPQRVIACGETRPVIQSDDAAKIEVQLGREKEPLPTSGESTRSADRRALAGVLGFSPPA